MSVLSARSSDTFVDLVDIQKAFDTSWVESALVRLFDAVVQPKAGFCGELLLMCSGSLLRRVPLANPMPIIRS